MESFSVILMEKNKESGLLEKEIENYTITNHGNLIERIYMMHEDEKDLVYVRITTDKDVEDWEFSAILDYYDEDILKDVALSCKEIDETYNPTWEVILAFIPTHEDMQKKLEDLLNKHKHTLDQVYDTIKDKKEEYK
ncbi:DUF6762 family protein [Marinisporobacter balticus]|uniref:Uncharacterized protein n=1 Tax=Marinisporobacter balticus TaxID=2018667 RepID=A0A4R2KKM8_9FIRM|nr:DUF6762 family protein [Marinisporobacter balticus]TCO74561.1 hypothetical protein EV214_11238 [Marinisporobacter balticus]